MPLPIDRKRQIQRLDVFEDGRIELAVIPEVCRPFDDCRVRKLRCFYTKLQAGFWVGPTHDVFGASTVELAGLRFLQPALQQRARSLPVVDEREGQFCILADQMFLEPLLALAEFT